MACSNDSKNRNPVPIAIAGMGMRLPGGVQSAEDFWELPINKKDGLCETPESGHNVESFYNPSQPRSVKSKKGYYLPDYLGKTYTSFWSTPLDDPGNFDPQQTLLMQVIWDCMETAGQVAGVAGQLGWRRLARARE